VRRVLLAVLLLAACRAKAPQPAPREQPAARPDAAPAAATAPAPPAEAPEGPLEAEEPEANPTSEKVKIKLVAWPVDAEVFWGAKKIGVAGKNPLELERPRASGPVDLVARAQGYLPFHTRVFTDRDEKLTIRLVRIEDAAGLLGYKRPAGVPPASP
jgi:hypothetical protein